MPTFLSILHLLICIQSREVWKFWQEFEVTRVWCKFIMLLSVNDKFQIVFGQSHRPSFVLLIIFFSSLKQEIFGKHGPLWIRVRHFIQVSHFSSLELIGLSWSPVLRSAKRAPANIRQLNNISDVIFYCSVGERSRALALLNAALMSVVRLCVRMADCL